jgi:chromate transporter
MQLAFATADWWALFAHFLSLSLLSIGGAITTAPEMHRFLVDEQAWLTDNQFTSSIALAQAAPGPNILFVALLGWNVGLNAATGMGWAIWGYGLLGVAIAMLGIMLPSTTLTFAAARWGHKNRELRAVRAFKMGMAPVVVALLIATGWILTASHGTGLHNWPLWLLTAASAVLVWRTRMHLLWLLGAGAVLGWFGWV